MIDLHIHSTASDGSCSPAEILGLAQSSGVTAVSITDHDTISGVKSLLKASLPPTLEFITGVEISCEPPQEFSHLGSIHLLGYGFSIYDKFLNDIFDQARESRTQRNPRIIAKLNELGLDISMQQVEERFGANQTGRPHIAEMMKELGYVDSFREAFDRYLGKDKPAYVDKYKISCKDAIKALISAGGVPVLAHPGLLEFKKSGELESFVDTLIGYGLMGIEIYYTDHDEALTRYYENLAEEKVLLKTGGSDFHGDFNAGVSLGKGKDNLDISPDLFRRLIDRVKEIQASPEQLDSLQNHLGYRFRDVSLLNNALCHRSYYNEKKGICQSDNERLEFLGDAVVGLCVGHLLMNKFPEKKEGELSKLRSVMVSEPALAKRARAIDLGRHIRLGRGETMSRGFEKNSILSDAFEAVMAAVYLDAGFDTVFDLVCRLFGSNLEKKASGYQPSDAKSLLQEYVQEQGDQTPTYEVVKESGPDHDKLFEVKISIGDLEATGIGRNKKAAEQEAARNVLMNLSDSGVCKP